LATWILFAQIKREKRKLDIAFANCQCCEVCPLLLPAPAFARRRVQLSACFRRSPSSACSPLSQQLRPRIEWSCLPPGIRGRKLLRSCFPHLGGSPTCPLARKQSSKGSIV